MEPTPEMVGKILGDRFMAKDYACELIIAGFKFKCEVYEISPIQSRPGWKVEFKIRTTGAPEKL